MNLKFLIGLCLLLPLCVGAVCAADVSSADDNVVSDLPALDDKYDPLVSEHPIASTDDSVVSDLPALEGKYDPLVSEHPIASTDDSVVSDLPALEGKYDPLANGFAGLHDLGGKPNHPLAGTIDDIFDPFFGPSSGFPSLGPSDLPTGHGNGGRPNQF